MPLLLIVVVVFVVAVVANVRKARQAQRTVPVPSASAVSPTFRVVALGVAGSGKTVFLASMFHRLHLLSPGGSYLLAADTPQRIALSQVFGQITNSDQPWPRGTYVGETREFTFDFVGSHEGARHKVFSISYLDYAGELLELEQEAGSGALADLDRRIKQAHALLGIIDGHRVRQLLRNEPGGRAYFQGAIQPMIGIMADSTCPIHFVLTKWDLVRDFGEPPGTDDRTRLGMVRDALLATMQLEALLGRLGMPRRIVRLIPVSAVGNNFVHIDPQGRVVKRLDGSLEPTNLEAPLSAVLPDLFRQAEASMDQTVRQEINSQVWSQMSLTPGESLAMAARIVSMPAAIVLRATLQIGVGRTYSDEIATMFLDWMGRRFDQKSGTVATARSAAEGRAQMTRQLRDQMFREFDATVLRLETELPASRLSG